MVSQVDLDQGGTQRGWERQYRGPSVGWINVPVNNVFPITAAGTYTLDPSTSLVTVNVAGSVTIILPSSKDPTAGAQALSGLFADNAITIVDIGGHSTATPITIQPKTGAETIMGAASISLANNFGGYVLQPNSTASSWNQVASIALNSSTIIGTIPIASGGTGQTTQASAFNALSPMTTQGDIIYRDASGNQRLAAGTSGYALITGGGGANPAWTGFLQSGTGAVTRTWNSKATDLISAFDFGAVGNGVNDDSTPINNAIARAVAMGGGTVILPPGNFRVASTVVIGGSNVILRGSGIGATIITGDLALTPVVRMGISGTSTFRNSIRDLTISRAAGTIPANAIGLEVVDFQQCSASYIRCNRHDWGRQIHGVAGVCIQYEEYSPYSSNIQRFDVYVTSCAGVHFYGGEFGLNGGETFDRQAFVFATGTVDDLTFCEVPFLPRGPGSVKPVILFLSSYTDGTGLIRFDNCISEAISSGIISDAGTTLVNDFRIMGGRYAYDTTFWNLNAATAMTYVIMAGVEASSIVNGIETFNNVAHCNLTGSNFTGAQFIGGAGKSIAVTGCTFNNNVSLSGAWDHLVFVGNLLAGGSFTDTSTGTKAVANNA